MTFTTNSTDVTQDSVKAEDLDYWIIGSEGDAVEPDNWPQDVMATLMGSKQFADAEKHKIVAQCVAQYAINNRNCLRVRKSFLQSCSEGWNYIVNFARDNNLSVIDNHGETYVPPTQDAKFQTFPAPLESF